MEKKSKIKFLPILIGVFAVMAILRIIMWNIDDSSNAYKTVKSKQNAEAKKNLPPKNSNFIEGSFELDVDLPLNEKTKVQYIIPVDPKTQKPKKSASNLIFYAPFNGEAGRIKRGLGKWHRYFPENFGYSIFSLTIEANVQVVDNKTKYYIYKEAGWFDIVFQIQQKLIKKFGLKKKQLLVVGESSGGSMAQRITAAFPDKIAATVWCGGSRYNLKQPMKVPVLAINVWGCYGVPDTRKLAKMNNNVMRCEGPPVWDVDNLYHHGSSKIIHELIYSYVQGIVELRDQNYGAVPPKERWPVKFEVNGKTQYLPSVKFADLWKKLPHELNGKLANSSRDLMKFILPDNPGKIVFLVNNSAQEDEIILQDSLYFLNMKKCIGVSLNVGKAPFGDINRVEGALKKILHQKEWGKFDVYVGGNGLAGQIAAVAALKNGNKRIKKIALFNSKYEYPFEELSIANYRKFSQIPLEIYSDVEQETALDAPENKFLSTLKTDNIEKKWFKYLDDLTK